MLALSFQARIINPSQRLKKQFPPVTGQDHSYPEPPNRYSTAVVRVDDRHDYSKPEATYYLKFQGTGAMPTYMLGERTDTVDVSHFVQAASNQYTLRGFTYHGGLPGFNGKRRKMLEVSTVIDRDYAFEGWVYRVAVQITVTRSPWLGRVRTLTVQQFLALAEYVRDTVLSDDFDPSA
ncbi:MAG TPA: hypothetical protein VFO38_03120 [Candidatus Saccharimonadales bacterium]|nr:hypothetical protein [Candidatus Saccharimonadales bacterium]